ncbi:unnamed protein product, partial [Medioppia subpectinata]
MHYYRVLLSVTHLRTPVLVSLSMVGADRWRRHNRTDDRPLAADLQPKALFGTIGTGWPAVSGLRRARMDETPEKIAKKAFNSLVTVKQTVVEGQVPEVEPEGTPDGGRVYTVATGFVVHVKSQSVNYVVTTAKAVGNAKYVTLSKPGFKDFKARCLVRYREPESDLALVVLPPKYIVTTTKSYAIDFVGPDVLKELKATRDVLTVTSAETYTSVTSGIVAHKCRTGAEITKIGKKYGFITPDMKYIQHTAAFPFDTVGSPLIDLKTGHVLGVSFYQQLVDGVSLYFAIPSYEIR